MNEQTIREECRTGWFARARCPGMLRYHRLRLGKVVLWLLLILLGSQLLSILMTVLLHSSGNMRFTYGGISADVGVALFLALVLGGLVAGAGTRFLLRFGTQRFSVWACNVVALVAAVWALLLGTAVISVMISYLTLAMEGIMPGIFALQRYTMEGIQEGAQLLPATGGELLRSLPDYLLWTAEWTCLFYLLACCFRRSKGWTLAVVIGVPLALFLLMLSPLMQTAVDTVRYGSEGEVMKLGMQWIQYLTKAARFVREKWQWIQLAAAVVSLPLSYLCMRTTSQP